MPIYEYRCDRCDHEFEREQRITADPVKTCPECKSRRVKRLISQTSFVLKGSGWYSDLYSSDSGKKSSEDTDKKATDSPGDSPDKDTEKSKSSKKADGDKSKDKKSSGKKSSKSSKNAD